MSGIKRITLLLTGISLVLGAGYAWLRWGRMNQLELKAAPGESIDAVYYPIIDTGDVLRLAPFYQRQVDFPIGFNEFVVDSRSPAELRSPSPGRVRFVWYFRRPFSVKRYGLVFLRWPPMDQIDTSDARILWLTADEMDAALQKGTLEVPLISTLPRADLSVLPK